MAYNPGVQFDPGLITGTGDRLAAGIMGIGNAWKQKRNEAKAADALWEALNPEVAAPDGAQSQHPLMPKDKWDSLSWSDKTSTMSGFIKAQALKSAIEDQKMQRQRSQLEQALGQQQLAAGQRQSMDDAALESALANAGTRVPAVSTPGMFGGPVAPSGNFGPPDAQSLLSAIRDNPAAARTPTGRAILMRALEMEGKAGGPPQIQKFNGKELLMSPGGERVLADVTPAPAAPQMPPGMEALRVEQDENGAFKIHYGFPKAEGKSLTQTEVNNLASLNQAEMDLNTLENIYKDLGPDYGGPVSGRVKSMVMGGQNPNIAALENAITAATPNLARGVFREVGVLTDQDVERYKKLLPSPVDTQEVRNRKIKQLRDRIAAGKTEMVKSLKAAGRDVEGFSDKSGADGNLKRFDSEAAARAANVGTNVFELYDPATASYRRARLK